MHQRLSLALGLTLTGLAARDLAQVNEPRQAEAGTGTVRAIVQGQWRFPGDKLLRITGRVKVLDAHTLLYGGGIEVDLNGGMDAPELAQKGLIGDQLYPCGQEAADFLKKLIGDKPVTCYADADHDGKRIRQADAFVGETNLNIEMVRNGWAMAHHSGMAAWEAMAREDKRGLWRGTFVFPERWRKGERLPEEN
jgi:endonuclease YncB( thermonuclease family)